MITHQLRQERLKELEDRIGYSFSNVDLLRTALTHSSASKDHINPVPCNERIEFLGDAVLEACVSEFLYLTYPMKSEGTLSRLRAKSVCENALYEMAKRIDLSTYLRLGKGEEINGGRNKPSLISDAFEALIGAVYLDGGVTASSEFIHRFVIDPQMDQFENEEDKDSKTRLQEYIQSMHLGRLAYRLSGEEGPDHCKTFSIEAILNDRVIGTGSGTSKKRAEEEAAARALSELFSAELQSK